MFTHCNVCMIEIRPGDIVVACEGQCDGHKYFHAKCVGLSYDEGCACLHSNIFWMCDCCRDHIEKGRFRNAMTEKPSYATRKEVDCLKSDVERISKLVSQFSTHASSEQGPSPKGHTGSKRQVISADNSSSPLSSTKIDNPDPAAEIGKDDLLQLYVTNIAIDVTDCEVQQMVCESIGANNVRSVKCLVPVWKDTSTMDYVSFKIVVDAKFRNVALKSSNWPAGVRCREFRDSFHTPWRPSNSTQLRSSS